MSIHGLHYLEVHSLSISIITFNALAMPTCLVNERF